VPCGASWTSRGHDNTSWVSWGTRWGLMQQYGELMRPCEAHGGVLGPLWGSWAVLGLEGPYWGSRGRTGAHGGVLGLKGPCWAQGAELGLTEATWGSRGRIGASLGLTGHTGAFWLYWGSRGHTRAFLGHTGANSPWAFLGLAGAYSGMCGAHGPYWGCPEGVSLPHPRGFGGEAPESTLKPTGLYWRVNS